MFSEFYRKNVIYRPKLVIFFLFLLLVCFGYYSKDFKLDASSDTLLLENDPDLKYLREVMIDMALKNF